MKLSFILLFIFVSKSMQVNNIWSWYTTNGQFPIFRFPFAFIADPSSDLVQKSRNGAFYPVLVPSLDSDFNSDNKQPEQEETPALSAENRANSDSEIDSELNISPRIKIGNNQRFLVNLWNSNLLSTKTLTQTVTLSTSTLVTTAVVQSCIPIAQFSIIAAAGGAAATTLTTPCAARKRSILIEEPSVVEAVPDIYPSSPEKILATVSPSFSHVEEGKKPVELEVLSSKDGTVQDEREIAVNARNKRSVIVFTTVTTTSFSYSFTSTVLAKTVSRGAPGGLICLPSGFIIC